MVAPHQSRRGVCAATGLNLALSMVERWCIVGLVLLSGAAFSFTDDFVDAYVGSSDEQKYAWGLPAILEANKKYDDRLANCIDDALPGSLCKPGKHRRISVDTKDVAEPVPIWEAELRRHHQSLRRESLTIPLNRFVPYCHHLDDCPNPSWRIMPLMVLKLKVVWLASSLGRQPRAELLAGDMR